MKLRTGDRVTYSAAGISALRPRGLGWIGRTGTVTTSPSDDGISVLWDGNKTTQRLHPKFIERIAGQWLGDRLEWINMTPLEKLRMISVDGNRGRCSHWLKDAAREAADEIERLMGRLDEMTSGELAGPTDSGPRPAK